MTGLYFAAGSLDASFVPQDMARMACDLSMAPYETNAQRVPALG